MSVQRNTIDQNQWLCIRPLRAFIKTSTSELKCINTRLHIQEEKNTTSTVEQHIIILSTELLLILSKKHTTIEDTSDEQHILMLMLPVIIQVCVTCDLLVLLSDCLATPS